MYFRSPIIFLGWRTETSVSDFPRLIGRHPSSHKNIRCSEDPVSPLCSNLQPLHRMRTTFGRFSRQYSHSICTALCCPTMICFTTLSERKMVVRYLPPSTRNKSSCQPSVGTHAEEEPPKKHSTHSARCLPCVDSTQRAGGEGTGTLPCDSKLSEPGRFGIRPKKVVFKPWTTAVRA